jgi:hypothetical protein
MINVGDPHQIAGLFDTFDHNIRLILNGRDRNPELTVNTEYRIQNTEYRIQNTEYRLRQFDDV